MSEQISYGAEFLPPPAKVFLLGIGGIGMSALAQLLLRQGYTVAGSDRGLSEPDKQELYDKLRQQGAALFPQDGSGPRAFRPDALVVSAAIEPGNADLAAAPALPIFHRALALSQTLQRLQIPRIAVAGSCGKTTVTGWLTSALRQLSRQVLMVNGGYGLDFEDQTRPGNFFADPEPEFAVFEVDESDRSIREFCPDYALLLNIGNDHYSTAELREVFAAFLARVKKAAVLPAQLAALPPPVLNRKYFSETAADVSSARPLHYQGTAEGCCFIISGYPPISCRQTGRHSAWNAAAVLQMLSLVLPSHSPAALAEAMCAFAGIRQRFELMSAPGARCPFINDYAHNPEKIAAALAAARERFGSPVLAVFQPHGFGPLGFMRQALAESLRESLQDGDQLLLLPVYYAGGSSSHKPTSQEVAEEYAAQGLPVTYVPDRETAATMIRNSQTQRCVLVMGARDASLRSWTGTLPC
ncbi:MAG: hypothetical protein GX902_02860 [Lentisphaerae bacterium]|nr:hypothetical protein [Lentisphaerota bacterium]